MNAFQLDQFTQGWVDGVPLDQLQLFNRQGIRYTSELTPHQAAAVFPNMVFDRAISGGYPTVYQPDRLYLNIEPSAKPRFSADFADFFTKESEHCTRDVLKELAATIDPDREYLPEVLYDMLLNHYATIHKTFVDVNLAIVDGTLGRYVPEPFTKDAGYAVYLMCFVLRQKDGIVCHGGVRLDGRTATAKDTWFFTEPKP